MGLVDEALARVVGFEQSGDLEGLLLDAKKNLIQGRPKHFFVRDLVNPQQAYWERAGKEPEQSDELKRVLAFGTRKHSEAAYVFSHLEGFSGAETKLDGAAAGLPGVRGKMDLRLGVRIAEFKTTPYSVETPEDVWGNVPQDVEQLLLYAIMWPHEVDEHLLIFHVNDDKPTRVFTVKIKDRGAITNAFRQRKDALRKALADKDPSLAKRCRYWKSPCAAREAGLCDCASLNEWNVGPLKKAASLARDLALEERVQKLWTENAKRVKPLAAWDLETPRKAFARITGMRPDEPYVGPESWAWYALDEADLLPGPLEDQPSSSIAEPLPFTAKGVWVKRTVTEGDAAVVKLTPTITRVWENDYFPKPTYKALYAKIMQLAAICALSNRNLGLLILETPQLQGEVVVYEYQFKDLAGFRKLLKERLGHMAKALTEEDISVLPTCPDWMMEKGDCEDCLCEDEA